MIYDITPITFNQLDLLSAGHPQGGFQQTGHMAHLATTDVDATDLIGVTRNGVLTAGCLIAWTRGRLGLEGSIWLGPLCALDDPKLLEHMTRGIRLAARRRHADRFAGRVVETPFGAAVRFVAPRVVPCGFKVGDHGRVIVA